LNCNRLLCLFTVLAASVVMFVGCSRRDSKVTVNGQDGYLCCASCEVELKSDPEKYLAKLNESK